MSYRPFGDLPLSSPSDGLKYSLFAGAILIQVLCLTGAGFLFVKATQRAHNQKRPYRLILTCAGILLAIIVALVDTTFSIYNLPLGQTNWSITLRCIGLLAVIALLIPASVTRPKTDVNMTKESLILVGVTVALVLVGISLTAVFWGYKKPIWGLRVASFTWELFVLAFVTAVTIYKANVDGLPDSKKESAYVIRCFCAVFFVAMVIVFSSLESPIPLLMRFMELVGYIGLGFVTYWCSLALDLHKEEGLPMLKQNTNARLNF